MSLVGESGSLSCAEPSLVGPRLAEPSLAGAGDYLALMKPRVMSLVVFTALTGLAVAGFSVVVLGLLVNLLAAALLAFTIFFYAVVYTAWLKRSTPQNIVIGGAAGAFPPMIGWAATMGSLSLEPW